MQRLVHVAFPPTGADRPMRRLRVALRDTSRADAPARVIAQTEVGPLVVPADGTTVQVVLDEDDEARRAVAGLDADEVTVFAHATTTPGDDIDPGDFLCTQSVPLPPGRDVEVPVTYLPVA